MRAFLIGDIVGRVGKRVVAERLRSYVESHGVDLVVANGENVAGGSGITKSLALKILKAGVDVITTGDHIVRKKDNLDALNAVPLLLRPANLPLDLPGKGYTVVEKEGVKIAVVNLIGTVFMPQNRNPFKAVDRILSSLDPGVKCIFVDAHCEATSEKIALGHHLDGRVTCVVGTHTHVPTADETILPKGTAYVTDIGMTGPYESILGRSISAVLRRFRDGIPTPFSVAENDVRMCGVLVDFDPDSGKALSMRRVTVFEN